MSCFRRLTALVFGFALSLMCMTACGNDDIALGQAASVSQASAADAAVTLEAKVVQALEPTAPADVSPADEVQPPTAADLQTFLAAIGGARGLGAMGIVMLFVQGLMLVLRSSLGQYAGAFRLTVVTGLTLVSGLIALKATGMDWASALMHSSTLAAGQVFLNQVWKQFVTKKD